MVMDKQLRPNRNGNLYLQVELSDRSGSIGARLWNASEGDYRSFENGDYVHVEGATQLFQGNMQLIATCIRRSPSACLWPVVSRSCSRRSAALTHCYLTNWGVRSRWK